MKTETPRPEVSPRRAARDLPSREPAIWDDTASDPMWQSWVGQTLLNYRLDSLLHRGAGGGLYRAHDLALDRRVAVKLLPLTNKDGERSEASVRALILEAREAARLRHPNVLTIQTIGHAQGAVFVVSELVEGGSVADYLANHGALKPHDATRVVCDVARGLAMAHAQGIIHRNIKPSNILRSGDGIAKLADFGLERRNLSGVSQPLAGRPVGDILYLSPEQFSGDLPDPRSDIYSLGATWFALLTGQPPYPGATLAQVAHGHLHGRIPDPRLWVSNIPDAAAELVMDCLAKSAEDRPDSVETLLESLHASGLVEPPTHESEDVGSLSWKSLVATAIASTEGRSHPGTSGGESHSADLLPQLLPLGAIIEDSRATPPDGKSRSATYSDAASLEIAWPDTAHATPDGLAYDLSRPTPPATMTYTATGQMVAKFSGGEPRHRIGPSRSEDSPSAISYATVVSEASSSPGTLPVAHDWRRHRIRCRAISEDTSSMGLWPFPTGGHDWERHRTLLGVVLTTAVLFGWAMALVLHGFDDSAPLTDEAPGAVSQTIATASVEDQTAPAAYPNSPAPWPTVQDEVPHPETVSPPSPPKPFSSGDAGSASESVPPKGQAHAATLAQMWEFDELCRLADRHDCCPHDLDALLRRFELLSRSVQGTTLEAPAKQKLHQLRGRLADLLGHSPGEVDRPLAATPL